MCPWFLYFQLHSRRGPNTYTYFIQKKIKKKSKKVKKKKEKRKKKKEKRKKKKEKRKTQKRNLRSLLMAFTLCEPPHQELQANCRRHYILFP
jgi:type III secretory pathway component EscR